MRGRETYLAATNHTLILIISKAALVADANESGGPHVRVADGAFAVAFIAETPDGDAGLLAAHDEITVRRELVCEPISRNGGFEGLTDDAETFWKANWRFENFWNCL